MRRRVPAVCLLFYLLSGFPLAEGTLAQGLPPGPSPGRPPSPPIGPVSREPDTDRPGQDYRDFLLERPLVELCGTACENDIKCTAYTYVRPEFGGPRCWLKSAVPQPIPSPCCVSGRR
jgi:hypothetical protein